MVCCSSELREAELSVAFSSDGLVSDGLARVKADWLDSVNTALGVKKDSIKFHVSDRDAWVVFPVLILNLDLQH